MKIEFKADKVDLGRRRVDNSRDVIFNVGEYQQNELAELLKINDVIINVTITIKEESK